MYFCKMLRICVDNGLEFNKNALKRSWKVLEFCGWDLLLTLIIIFLRNSNLKEILFLLWYCFLPPYCYKVLHMPQQHSFHIIHVQIFVAIAMLELGWKQFKHIFIKLQLGWKKHLIMKLAPDQQDSEINSLWPSDVIWWQRSGSTLAQVMASCLTAPSNYLNQCWLIISEVQWHS